MNPLTISEKLFERYEKVIGSADNYFGILAIFALALTAEAGNNQKLIEKCCTAMSSHISILSSVRRAAFFMAARSILLEVIRHSQKFSSKGSSNSSSLGRF